MRTVGHRQPAPISFAAPATPLVESSRFNDENRRLPSGRDSLVPDKDIAECAVLERALAALNTRPEKP